MVNKKRYLTDFYPVFYTINHCLDQLDELGIESLVGARSVRLFADSFVQLVWRTFDALPFDAPLSTSDKLHDVESNS